MGKTLAEAWRSVGSPTSDKAVWGSETSHIPVWREGDPAKAEVGLGLEGEPGRSSLSKPFSNGTANRTHSSQCPNSNMAVFASGGRGAQVSIQRGRRTEFLIGAWVT